MTPTKLPAPARFYRGDTYAIETSVGHDLRVLMNSLNRAIDREMQAHDLTAMQWKPLLMLKFGRVDTAAGLARLNCSDTGAMTRMLDRLEAKGLLRRVRSAQDRRVVHLALTPAGRRVADRIPDGLSNALNAHLAGFSKAEFTQLRQLVLRMIANGERANAEADDATDDQDLP